MADGSKKAIERVKVGDIVLASTPGDKGTRAQEVVATWVHSDEPQRTELVVDTDGTAGDETGTVEATDWHPVWVENRHRWLPIAHVQAGDSMLSSAGERLQVVATRTYKKSGLVYDLTVGDLHTFYVAVGGSNVLVHNSGGKLEGDEIFLWRAVTDPERNDIHSTRSFRSTQGIKYFSYTERSAAEYARRAYDAYPDEGPYTMIRTKARMSDLPEIARMTYTADVIDGGVALQDDALKKLSRPQLMPGMSCG